MDSIDRAIERWKARGRSGLIPLLQELQEQLGYLPDEAMLRVAEALDMPSVKVWGVATYYDQFRFRARGRHHLRLCRGTACHVASSRRLLEATMKLLSIGPGETTRDGSFSLELVPCLGACAQAPALEIDGRVHGAMTVEKLWGLLAGLREGEGGEGVQD